MKVTKVYVNKIEEKNSLVGFASITLDDAFVVKGLKIVDGRKGLFISFPSEEGPDGKYYDTAFPTTKELREDITEAVLDEYDKTPDPKEKKSRRK